MSGFWEEVWQRALVELCLSDHTSLEEVLAGAIEGSVKEGEECKSIFAEDLAVEVVDCASDVNALENRIGGSHCVCFVVFVEKWYVAKGSSTGVRRARTAIYMLFRR